MTLQLETPNSCQKQQPARSGRIRARKSGKIEWGPSGARFVEPVEIVALLSMGCAVHTHTPLTPGTTLKLLYNGIETPAIVSYSLRQNNLSHIELGLTFLESATE
jgi:hypothetical protein